MNISQHTSCLICNSRKLQSLNTFESTFLVKCADCSFVFSQKIPTEQELLSFYDGYGRNDYLSPVTIKRYHELLDKFEPYKKTGKILDVGCGIGYFLNEAKNRGWKVYGTEYTDHAIEICESKGIEMKQGKLNITDFNLEEFDVITSFEVLEHINNPMEEIGNFIQLLRTGGLVYLTTPNFNSVLRFKLKEKYDVITYPEHLSYYTPKTLRFAFNKNGFKTKKIETTGISLSKLQSAKQEIHVNPISKDSADEHLRSRFEKNVLLKKSKQLINFSLTTFGVGDSLKGWFEKK
jgi:SAM-dependent methyltransferase